MKTKTDSFHRPRTAAEVVHGIDHLEDFGYQLRDWQHELRKVSSRRELEQRLAKAPGRVARRFDEGEIADAYLAGYCAFLADCAGIKRPEWTSSPSRISRIPWFSHQDRKRLLVTTPCALREKNMFTEAENVLRIRRGRPSRDEQHKKKMNALRQKRYRQRIKEELTMYRSLFSEKTKTLPPSRKD